MTENWENAVQAEFSKPYFQELYKNIYEEYSNNICHPDWNNIFRAFDETDINDVKAVIIGQDPYHGTGQAQGLCFSVNKGIKIPPSLINIYKEIEDEYGYPAPSHGDLTSWAKQGVLLLNSTPVKSTLRRQP